ncbi:glycosyltransferase involved in cell wall biosynthesis [Thermomonas haemolytica]|uniref:Glycosyltransferase involved in cell wall biosynthesis n=2 Tax=Thermomonas haemolytica TaxID=141949 RepID=A0A4R3N5U9_9GAMM|nr:glycosyltransferase involved in cell wall biosynthesis [Thermomonas haemolytica]TNY29283.1 hypothetical protein BV505_06425 [Thermomonas haemolytica]
MTQRHGWIAYVGPFPFPSGTAGSRRMLGVALSLAAAGRRVVVGSGDPSPTQPTPLGEGDPAGNIAYVGLGESPAIGASVLRKAGRIFWSWGRRTVAWLDAQPVKPACVVVYGGSAQYLLRLLPWCRRHGVPLVADVVEWYDPRQMTGGRFGPFNLSAQWALRRLYPRTDGVIAISRLLADHYSETGRPVVRVPPTLDVHGIEPGAGSGRADGAKLRLVYAGTPGKKDLLGNVIEGVEAVDPGGTQVELMVLGPSPDEVRSMLGGREIPRCVRAMGRVVQAEVAVYLASADFSVLLREPARFSNAGFPTKFVESMAHSTPVIANLTSDMALFLHHGEEGLVCSDWSASAFSDALREALALAPTQLAAMRNAARRQAERSFDYRGYSGALSEFLGRLQVGS